MFIRTGFEYLMQMQKKHATGLYRRAIDDGIDACNYLVELFRNPSEKRRVSALHILDRPK
jgi:hypothetical protein